MKEIQRDGAIGKLIVNIGNKILNAVPKDYSTLKIVALAVLSIFSSTYSCESLFSEINFIKSDLRNRLTDECSVTCTLLKVTNYTPNINELASSIQQKNSHQENKVVFKVMLLYYEPKLTFFIFIYSFSK
jgi:hypothetical protein